MPAKLNTNWVNYYLFCSILFFRSFNLKFAVSNAEWINKNRLKTVFVWWCGRKSYTLIHRATSNEHPVQHKRRSYAHRWFNKHFWCSITIRPREYNEKVKSMNQTYVQSFDEHSTKRRTTIEKSLSKIDSILCNNWFVEPIFFSSSFSWCSF